jgi:hypothetical protein
VFSVQCSVFSREKTRGCRGRLAACASPPMGPASSDQLEYGWVGMGPKWQKSFAHLCTRLHMPGHFLHMPGHGQTCLYMPEHPRTAVESPSPKRKRGPEKPSLAWASG